MTAADRAQSPAESVEAPPFEDAGAINGAGSAADEATGLQKKPLAFFILTLLVVIAVLGLLPTALQSMLTEMQGQSTGRIYDLFTGLEVDAQRTVAPDAAFVNVTVTNLDEARLIASLTLSGHRVCGTICPPITATFYSLGNDAARRRGLPPSASVSVPRESGSYTFNIELPIQGAPQLYPFDDYTLQLGLMAFLTLPDGTQQLLDRPELVRNSVSLTLEDLVARLNMKPPQPVDPALVRSPSDPTDFMLVDRLVWERPRYLRIITIMLVILISASGVFALGLRSLHELVLGIGGIILGIWGVRSVVVQSPLPDVTLIDLVLGFVMLALMLALAMRAARYFYMQSGLKTWRRG
jgi:hypothetical protein